jgi:hypothetical protein
MIFRARAEDLFKETICMKVTVTRHSILFPVLGLCVLAVLAGPPPVAAAAENAKPSPGGFVYDAHDKRDPFAPLVNSQGTILNYEKDLSVTDLVLEGIFADGSGANAAIINGKILQVNEAIGDFTVKDIKGNKVTLQKGEERIILKLKKEE